MKKSCQIKNNTHILFLIFWGKRDVFYCNMYRKKIKTKRKQIITKIVIKN